MGRCPVVRPRPTRLEEERSDDERVGTRRRGRNGLRADRRRRARGRAVPRGDARGGAGVLHQAVRRAGGRSTCSSSGSTPAWSPRTRRPSRSQPPRPGRRRARRRRPHRLVGRLDALLPVIAQQRQARRAERAEKAAAAKAEKERLVAEAEKLAEGNDWRNGANRLRQLLDEWKALPRIDRASDDALWRRFSTARTAYTRRRKAHFAEQNEKRDAARVVKERLAKEAEALASSTEWGPTAGAYRDLMRQWKAAGPAPRDVEDELWKRFRGAQDTFFGARDEAMAAQDAEFAANAEAKEKLLVEAEALVPVTDVDGAKRAIRDIAERWDATGKVPRDQIRELEGRMREVEQAIRGVEEEQWRRTDPEKSARADDMVAKLEEAIAKVEADLEKARAAGDEQKVTELEENLASRRAFLEMAQRASADFSG